MLKLVVKASELPPLPRFSEEEEAAIRGEAAAMVCGVVKSNFTQLAAKSGSRRFWHGADALTRVAAEEDGRAIVVVSQRGVRLHWKGGEVRPTGRPSAVTGKPTKSLLIPFPDSPLRKRGISLAELGVPKESMHVIKSKKGCPILVAGIEKKRHTNLIWLGKLVKRAHFEARPEVLPSENELQRAALTGGISKIQEILNRL